MVGSALIWISMWLKCFGVVAGIMDVDFEEQRMLWARGVDLSSERKLKPMVISENVLVPICAVNVNRVPLSKPCNDIGRKRGSSATNRLAWGDVTNGSGSFKRIILFGDLLYVGGVAYNIIGVDRRCLSDVLNIKRNNIAFFFLKCCKVVLHNYPCSPVIHYALFERLQLRFIDPQLLISERHVRDETEKGNYFGNKAPSLLGLIPLGIGIIASFYGGWIIRFGRDRWFHYLIFFFGFGLMAVGWITLL